MLVNNSAVGASLRPSLAIAVCHSEGGCIPALKLSDYELSACQKMYGIENEYGFDDCPGNWPSFRVTNESDVTCFNWGSGKPMIYQLRQGSRCPKAVMNR